VRYLSIAACLISVVGCQTAPKYEVADNLILERVYCGLSDDISYAYDKDRPTESDTLETVEQIIAHNAVRKRICKGQVNEIPLEADTSGLPD
jgi:hypothetical protein